MDHTYTLNQLRGTDFDIRNICICIYHSTHNYSGNDMAYKDGENFTTYCDKDYDRHTYKLVLKNGKSVTFEDYNVMRYHWYQYRKAASHVIVCDK